MASEMKTVQFDAAWAAIQSDDSLKRARSRLSLEEMRTIVQHCGDAFDGVSHEVYISAVNGRREFRNAYRALRSARGEKA